MKKTGRPKKYINQKQFESLCAIQCTQEEICGVLDVCDETLTDWCRETYGKRFSEVFKIKRQLGKASLRRSQWKLAEKNATMGIWLGKQYLGQKDEQQLKYSGELTQNVNLMSEEEKNKKYEELKKRMCDLDD